MGSNSFGQLFRITTWGESHGKSIGVVIDGCPAGVPLTEEIITAALAVRTGGKRPHTTPRREADVAEIHSGVFNGLTTGTPISIIITNTNADSSHYEAIKNTLRPGHANFTYQEKYGLFDYRGGGRASARETACRVAAGAVAKQLLAPLGVEVLAHLSHVGGIATTAPTSFQELQQALSQSDFFVADAQAESRMHELLEQAESLGDSVGGIVSFIATGVPAGWGDPVYEKLEANLAKAMLSIPASKGFEIGAGFAAAGLCGSQHNDAFIMHHGKVATATNNAGGTLGGISTGMPLWGTVAFKPTSSIKQPQATLTAQHEPVMFTMPEGSRHDVCVAIRAVPVVEAMCWLVLADAFLLNQACRIEMLR